MNNINLFCDFWIPNDVQTQWASQHDGIRGSCWLFDFWRATLRKIPVGLEKEIDCDIGANHQGTLFCLMEILFSVEEFKVKRLVPQCEQRMWEWHLTTRLLSVSQTTKRHRRCLLTLLVCHLLTVTQGVPTMNGNIKWNFYSDINWFQHIKPAAAALLNNSFSWYYFVEVEIELCAEENNDRDCINC